MHPPALFRPPLLRTASHGEHSTEERHASWMELFYDLAFVAVIGHLAGSLANEVTLPNLGLLAFLVATTWWGWTGQAFYLTRFDSDDVATRLLSLTMIVGVAAMAAHVPAAMDGDLSGYVLSYVFVRLVLVLEYARAWRAIPEARAFTQIALTGFSLAVALWLAGAFAPAPARFALLGLALAVDFVTPFIRPDIHVRFPPDVSHIPERFGLFTIILLGEAILATILGLGSKPPGFAARIAGILGICMAGCHWWVYFDRVQGAAERRLTSRQEAARYRAWLFAHLPLTFGIVVSALGVKHIMKLSIGEPLHGIEGLVLGGAVLTVFLAMHLIYATAFGRERRRELRHHFVAHALVTASVVPVTLIGPWLPGHGLLALLTRLAMAHVGLVLHSIVRLRRHLQATQ